MQLVSQQPAVSPLSHHKPSKELQATRRLAHSRLTECKSAHGRTLQSTTEGSGARIFQGVYGPITDSSGHWDASVIFSIKAQQRFLAELIRMVPEPANELLPSCKIAYRPVPSFFHSIHAIRSTFPGSPTQKCCQNPVFRAANPNTDIFTNSQFPCHFHCLVNLILQYWGYYPKTLNPYTVVSIFVSSTVYSIILPYILSP